MGLVNEVMKEIGNKSREFYEFVLPPVDMYLNEDSLKLVIDIPGFAKKDIELTLCGDILSIKAEKIINEKELESLISNQRPNLIDKKIIRIPSTESSLVSERNIPEWIKTTAKWWSNNDISDNDFLYAIEYLIKKGIIRI